MVLSSSGEGERQDSEVQCRQKNLYVWDKVPNRKLSGQRANTHLGLCGTTLLRRILRNDDITRELALSESRYGQ